MSTESEVYYAIQSAMSEGMSLSDFLELVREQWRLNLSEQLERVDYTFKEAMKR